MRHRIIFLRPGPKIIPAYLGWFLNRNVTKLLVSELASKGSSVPVVPRQVLENLKIPLPDLDKQKHIVKLNKLIHRELELLSKKAEAKKTESLASACAWPINQS